MMVAQVGCRRSDTVKQVDLPFFVELGSALESATRLNPKAGVWDAYFAVFRLRRTLATLMAGQHARLHATAHDMQTLCNAIDHFGGRYFRDEKGNLASPPEGQTDEFAVSQISSAVQQFKTVLIADLRTAAAFSVMTSGIFDANMLVNSASQALGESSRQKVEASTLEELDASGKCLAFNLPTASGFHAMRAVERVIKLYLGNYIAAEEIQKMNNWGQYISALEKRLAGEAEPKPSQEAIALLRQIKDIYRNPVIHPERTLSLDEASALFHSTLAAITRVAIELRADQPLIPGLFGATAKPAGLFGAAAALLAKDAA
jgi:hypothetical protein